MPSTETAWVVPSADSLDNIMSQLVLNAGEKDTVEQGINPELRADWTLAQAVTRVRSAIQAAARFPVSQEAGSVPPEAELHVMVLTVNSMTASKPNLGTIVLTLNGGVVSPFNDLVKRAEKFIQDCKDGKAVTLSSWPAVTGNGCELVIYGTSYASGGTVTVTGLIPGLQYSLVLGPNDTGLTCGNVTLSASGSFYAPQSSAVLSGTGSALVTASLQRSRTAVNLTRGGSVHGMVDMGTDGPGQSGGAYRRDWTASTGWEDGTL